MSDSVLAISNNGGGSPKSVPGRSPGFFKSSVNSPSEEAGHQPPAPPHRSFSSDVGALSTVPSVFSCQAQQTEQNNR